MLDPRIYRAGWVPLLFVLIVVGFSLREPPAPIGSTLTAQAFDGGAAAATLRSLQSDPALRDRAPGSTGDDVLAGRVAARLRARRFQVHTERLGVRTAAGGRSVTAVIARRAGFSNRRIVVVSQRDTIGGPSPGRLSSTAALLELARVLGGRTLGRTVDLISVSGADGGAAGQALARSLSGPVEAVLVLGDLGGTDTHRPWVVPFSSGSAFAPLPLRLTVEAAVRTETGERPGGISPVAQWVRLAFPLTASAQGPLLAHGFPAVLVGPSGERGGGPREGVTPNRLDAFGRAALRTVTALDSAPPSLGRPARYLLIANKVMPPWAIRLLVAALILPVLLAGIDGFARVRRRRQPVSMWLRWAAAGVLPFALLVLLLRALRATGLLAATPPGPVASATLPLDGAAWSALGACAAVLLLGWLVLRPLVLRLSQVRGDPFSPGAAAALVLLLSLVAVVAWALNPFAAALIVPALHLWTFAVAPDARLHPSLRAGLLVLGLLAPLLVAISYGSQLNLGPARVLWMGALQVAGGGVPLLSALGWCVVLGVGGGVGAVVLRAARGHSGEADPVTVRGPSSYAGPGSLGGTKSALRR